MTTTTPLNIVGRYAKRPVEIEAIQFLGTLESHKAIHEFIGDAAEHDHWDDRGWAFDPESNEYVETTEAPEITKGGEIEIVTLEGRMTVSPQDYVIKGIKGEFYPCKPDIFEDSYQFQRWVNDPDQPALFDQ